MTTLFCGNSLEACTGIHNVPSFGSLGLIMLEIDPWRYMYVRWGWLWVFSRWLKVGSRIQPGALPKSYNNGHSRYLYAHTSSWQKTVLGWLPVIFSFHRWIPYCFPVGGSSCTKFVSGPWSLLGRNCHTVCQFVIFRDDSILTSGGIPPISFF